LWVRYFNSVQAQPLKGTEGALFPFWSPDGRSIGFAASGSLKRVDLDGGAVRKLANAPLFLGGSWNTDGTILFVPNTGSPVFRISDSGGEPVEVTSLQSQSVSHHHFPHALPDGRHFLYYVLGAPEIRGVYMADLKGGTPRHLLNADAAAVYAPQGRLLFLRDGTLLSQQFDPTTGALDGPVSPVVEKVAWTGFSGATLVAASASRTGPIAYRTQFAQSPVPYALRWLNRAGTVLETIKEAPPFFLNPSLSRDDRRLALFINTDIWLFDMTSRTPRKFTYDPANDFAAVWSPDGNHIAFNSNRRGEFDLYQKDAIGTGGDELLLQTSEGKTPTDWSSDSQYLLYRSLSPTTTFDLWALSVADRKPFKVVATSAEERDGQFSPDGKWIAYQSNETGLFQIWVRPFPAPGTDVKPDDRWLFSNGGGTQVRWGRDGKELFYVALDGRLMAVPVNVEEHGRAVTAGPATPLFSIGTPIFGGGTALPWYSVSGDVRDVRFLVTNSTQPAVSVPITVLLNWKPQP
jgi:WD40 repeat protein